jgi:hypothetical protein
VYRVERGRIAADAFERFVRELNQDRPAFKVIPLDYDVAGALRSVPQDVVPDMRDRRLQAAESQTIW